MLEMYDALGTEASLKRKVAFSDVGDHVMTCSITSKDLESVQKETERFFDEVLAIDPIPEPELEVVLLEE